MFGLTYLVPTSDLPTAVHELTLWRRRPLAHWSAAVPSELYGWRWDGRIPNERSRHASATPDDAADGSPAA
jgi:hypothetical protein